jgi:hypothetical protein
MSGIRQEYSACRIFRGILSRYLRAGFQPRVLQTGYGLFRKTVYIRPIEFKTCRDGVALSRGLYG